MEEISYKVTIPDPYQTAYDRVIMEFSSRLIRREMDGIEAALKEHGYVKERTCTRVGIKYREVLCQIEWKCSECGFPLYSDHDNYCTECGAKVTGD